MDSYSYEQIAAATGCSMGEVKSHLQNGVRRPRLLCTASEAGTKK